MFDQPARLASTCRVDSRVRSEVLLEVGDAVQVGDVICTVVEIAGEEVHLRVDPAGAGTEDAAGLCFESVAR